MNKEHTIQIKEWFVAGKFDHINQMISKWIKLQN